MSHETNMPAEELTCRDVAEFLLAYTEGELATDTRKAFDAHLSQCSSCVRYVEHYRRTVAMAQAVGRTVAGVDAPPGVLRAIREARMKAG